LVKGKEQGERENSKYGDRKRSRVLFVTTQTRRKKRNVREYREGKPVKGAPTRP